MCFWIWLNAFVVLEIITQISPYVFYKSLCFFLFCWFSFLVTPHFLTNIFPNIIKPLIFCFFLFVSCFVYFIYLIIFFISQKSQPKKKKNYFAKKKKNLSEIGYGKTDTALLLNNNNNNNNNYNHHLGKLTKQTSDDPCVTSILSQKSMDYVRRNSYGDLSTFFIYFF